MTTTGVRGRFVAFEGGEAVGKSTQARRLAERLDAVRTFEPGATTAGATIRSIFLDPATGDLDPRTEALLMAADRAEHVASEIEPALAGGRHVVTDRYLYSSVAYQAHGRGLDPTEVRDLSLWATGGLQPDLVVFLDLPVEVARARVHDVAPDRLEAEEVEFHERVRAGFRIQADADPDRWLVIDASLSADEIEAQIWKAVAPLVAGG
ncbi:dTMP kinase [Actinospongicola halichondriae]|uniref:dTMP kinase n=1 Tax=Actinospongicola halichondriae TaxID=3236844 RepID=UPI003D5937E5